MTTAIETPARMVDLDARERDLVEKIEGFNADRQRLALEALTDEGARVRLSDVEAELSEAEGEVQRLGLARTEQLRLDAEARQEQLEGERAAALQGARRLQATREEAAAAVDATAQAFALAILKYAEVCGKQQARLLEAGYSENWAGVARFQGYPVEAAFACALRETGAGQVPAFDRLPTILVAHQKPLAESDPRVVEPLAGKTSRGGEA